MVKMRKLRRMRKNPPMQMLNRRNIKLKVQMLQLKKKSPKKQRKGKK